MLYWEAYGLNRAWGLESCGDLEDSLLSRVNFNERKECSMEVADNLGYVRLDQSGLSDEQMTQTSAMTINLRHCGKTGDMRGLL